MQQAEAFREETEVLHATLAGLADADFERTTLFKSWTVNDVLGHLHFWNYAADLSLRDGDAFLALFGEVAAKLAEPGGHMAFTRDWLEGRAGKALCEQWYDYAMEMADRFSAADPDRKLKWAGPDMKASTSITARQMETWAHGQEVYDLLGVDCPNSDRIANIVLLGVKTYGWAYANRGLTPPKPAPWVRLTSPSGALWEYNVPESGAVDEQGGTVEGTAVDFAKVVTQTRNVADTGLAVRGANAEDWMRIVQCFAGPPEDPPAPGTRYLAR
jgi:uncharacterized protein (TIGR03084 family)